MGVMEGGGAGQFLANWMDSGGVLSEFTVTKLADNQFYLVSAAAALRQDEDLLRVRSLEFDLNIENVTDATGVFAIMGLNACTRF
jgi:dimethylglycine dehydrogenase